MNYWRCTGISEVGNSSEVLLSTAGCLSLFYPISGYMIAGSQRIFVAAGSRLKAITVVD
jgi:hypothetical protein